jgi:hypothetical protein
MTKQQLLDKVAAKTGYVSIAKDDLAPDHIPGDPIEKRYLYINVLNADGTMGKTYQYYLYNTTDGTAAFYNVESEVLDTKAMTNDQKRFDNIEKYLKQNFHSYFIREVNMNIDTLFADVYTDNGTNLVKQQVAAFKRGTNAIEHKVIT